MRELKIAIVDDMPADREWLALKLEAYMRERHINYALHEFASGEEFVSAMSGFWFNIVFMDIYMGEMTGVQAAQHLRARDRDCKLVFLTTSDEHMRQGFSLNSAHYLIKPVSDDDFLQAMANCRIRRECQVPYIELPCRKTGVRMDTQDVLYIDVQSRVALVHTKQGAFQAGRCFQQLVAQLKPDERFLLCNKGLLVNMDFIASLEECDFVMMNGERLPVAPRRKKELAAEYHSYTFGCLGD